MERKEMESAVAQATYLRGLYAIPAGLMFIVTGLSNMSWGPFGPAWAFVASIAAIGATTLGIWRFYNRNYGRVVLTNRQQVKYNAASLGIFGAAMVGGPILDFNLDLPISIFATSFAVGMLVLFAMLVGLRARHLVVWGSLLVIGLIPVWGGLSDKISVAWLPIGAAAIVAGILDHLALARSFGPPRDVDLENSNAGA